MKCGVLLHNGPYVYRKSYSPIGGVRVGGVLLNAEQEEFVYYFSRYIGTKHFTEKFKTNFWNSMEKYYGLRLKNRKKIDYNRLKKMYQKVKVIAREPIPEKNKFCVIDGDRVRIRNPVV